jgi:LacI family transcriptional regulator
VTFEPRVQADRTRETCFASCRGKAAGVSTATVSRVVHQSSTVNSKTSKRVLAVISELGYSPNMQARVLACGRSRLLGLVVPKAANPFIAELIPAMEKVASELGYGVLINFIEPEREQAATAIKRTMERGVEFLAMIIPWKRLLATIDLESTMIPYVCIDCTRNLSRGCAVNVDFARGIRECVQHLAALGHRYITIASQQNGLYCCRSGVNDLSKALAECGIDIDPFWLAPGDASDSYFFEKLFTGSREFNLFSAWHDEGSSFETGSQCRGGEPQISFSERPD